MTKVKPAATIMLARNRGIMGIEVLLLRRNRALKFASGFWVFPGGKVEPSESKMAANELEAAKIAAVRETKEETNINIPLSDLIFFNHWTTPVVEPRRFATWFFFADVSASEVEVKVDGSELEEHLWINPQKAIDKAHTGEIILMPPTYMCLQRISQCKDIAAIRKELSLNEPAFILPNLIFKNNKIYCLYEGDAGYKNGDIDTPGPRHRLVGNSLKGGYTFFYSDCEHIFPINGSIGLKMSSSRSLN